MCPILIAASCVFSTEGQLPRGAQYLGQKVTVDGDKTHTDTYYATPTEETTTTSKTVEHKPVVYEGIGPIDQEGVPLAFRKVAFIALFYPI
jgi:hypothetical protein